jgi:hypothetical protein
MVGEMVAVQCEREGYDIGFVDGEAFPDPDNPPQKKILAKLKDEDNTIKDQLKLKIVAEKNALMECRRHCRNHHLTIFADMVAAEFQFDHKKLTFYLKKYEEVSVDCLVRNLYDHYQIRIKILEIDDPETMKALTKKYLELSKFPIPLYNAYDFDHPTSVLTAMNQRRSKKFEPNYSKRHLKHLVPSLAQYGPQRTSKVSKQSVYPASAITITPSIIGAQSQTIWSDHLSSNEYLQQQILNDAQDQCQSQHQFQTPHSHLYQQPYFDIDSCHNGHTDHPYAYEPPLSWSSHGNHRSNWDEVGGGDQFQDRQLQHQQFDELLMYSHTRHHNLQPFDHRYYRNLAPALPPLPPLLPLAAALPPPLAPAPALPIAPAVSCLPYEHEDFSFPSSRSTMEFRRRDF